MISIVNKGEPKFTIQLSKDTWVALAGISLERQITPEEMVELWVARYIQNKLAIEKEEAEQKEEKK